jgi:hypothetical protein
MPDMAAAAFMNPSWTNRLTQAGNSGRRAPPGGYRRRRGRSMKDLRLRAQRAAKHDGELVDPVGLLEEQEALVPVLLLIQ